MNVRFYGYLMWTLTCAALGYLERWIHYGEYTAMWFVFTLGSIFFLALCKYQLSVDRDEAKKNGDDNPF